MYLAPFWVFTEMALLCAQVRLKLCNVTGQKAHSKQGPVQDNPRDPYQPALLLPVTLSQKMKLVVFNILGEETAGFQPLSLFG